MHRIGQIRDVKVSRLTVEGSVEERILELQKRKRELIDGALGDADVKKGSKKLTVDEMMYLFGLS